MKIRTSVQLSTIALLVCLSNIPAAYAATATTNFTVTATVPTICLVSATNLSFGSYTGTVIDAQSAISVTCTTGTGYTVGLDDGQHILTGQRRMLSGTTDFLNYDLYTDPGRGTPWIGATTVAGTGNGLPQSLPVYGRLPGSQTLTAGSYSDTIAVTVTY